MQHFVALFLLAMCTAAAVADEPKKASDPPSAQPEGGSPKPYVTGGPLPKSCSEAEWKEAIEAVIAATRDIPRGSTAEFIAKANEAAARFGC